MSDEDHDHDGWFTRLLDTWSVREQARMDAIGHRYDRNVTGVLVVVEPSPGSPSHERGDPGRLLVSIDGGPWVISWAGAVAHEAPPGRHEVELCAGRWWPRAIDPWHVQVPVVVPAAGLVCVEVRIRPEGSTWGLIPDPVVRVHEA